MARETDQHEPWRERYKKNKTLTERVIGDVAAIQASAPPEIRSTDGMDALAERWERRLSENTGPTDSAWTAAKTIQLRECLDELRSYMGSASIEKLNDGCGNATTTQKKETK